MIIRSVSHLSAALPLLLIAFSALNVFAHNHNNVQVFAMERRNDLLCAIEITDRQSRPVCKEPSFFQNFQYANQTMQDKEYLLEECPESWVKNNACVKMPVRRKKVRANPFLTLYNDLIKHPAQQIIFFIHNSSDDLVEDIIALGLPAITGLFSHHTKMGTGYTLTIVLGVHTLSSPLGDLAGDWVYQFQKGTDSEKEIEWLLPEVIANKIEDGIKTVFIVICYGNTLLVKTLKRQQPGYPSLVYNTVMTALVAYDTYQFFERYNWINEIADAIADMFSELFRQ